MGSESDEGTGILGYYVITFDNNGKRFRTDYFLGNEEENHLFRAEITNHFNKTYWEYTFYYDENNPNDYGWRWVDSDYKKAPKDGGIPFQFSASEASLLSGGFTKLSNKTYAGKSCSVYTKPTTITAQGQTVTMRYTFAVWNGLILFWEYAIEGGGESSSMFYVAQAVTLDVPEVAFTKTIDISWLP